MRYSNILIFLATFVIVGCSLSFTNLEYHRGKNAAEKGDYKQALVHYRRVIQRDSESNQALSSAREAARITYFELKSFKEAIFYFEHLVKFSGSEKERRDSQEKIAQIYFENLSDYGRAIEEYNKLLLLRATGDQGADYHFNLSRAHFYLNHFTEAQNEIEQALKTVESEEKKFDYLMFQGNILFNTKRTEEAVKVYEEIIKKFPSRAKKDNVAMNVIVCLEEMESFDAAIEKLEVLKLSYHDPEFIELKIKRLKERRANMPGSRGLRK